MSAVELTDEMSPATSFRNGMRRLVGAVTAIASRMPDGTPVGLAATAVCSVSVDPPTLLVCVNTTSSLGRAVAVGQSFSVNVLGADQESLARAFGGMTGLTQAQRFELGGWDMESGCVPVLRDAEATFECRVSSAQVSGSHYILLGTVERVRTAQGEGGALGYLNGGFVSVR